MKASEWVTYAVEAPHARKTVHWRIENKGESKREEICKERHNEWFLRGIDGGSEKGREERDIEGNGTERNVCPWEVPLVKQRKEKGEGNHEGNGRSS